MVLLKYLNNKCKNRLVAQHCPSQVICRFLGNPQSPCVLNDLCEPTEQKGLLFFYSCITSAFLAIYILAYWILHATRLKRPLNWVLKLVFKPIAGLLYALALMVKFYKGLPF